MRPRGAQKVVATGVSRVHAQAHAVKCKGKFLNIPVNSSGIPRGHTRHTNAHTHAYTRTHTHTHHARYLEAGVGVHGSLVKIGHLESLKGYKPHY